MVLLSTFLLLGGCGNIAHHFLESKIDLNKDYVIIADIKEIDKKFVSNSHILYFKMDMSDENQYTDLINYFDDANIKIDKILFAVGINPMSNFFTSNVSDFKNTFDKNFFSLYITLKKVYHYINDIASIVVIASQNGLVGHEDRVDYGPSKAALIQLVKNLTIDFNKYSHKDIKVNCISPGYVLTSSNEQFFASPRGKKLLSKNIRKHPVLLDEVSEAIAFLFESKTVSYRGQNLIIDNGYTIT